MNKILGIIPARYDSTRLKGKSLADIGGKSMIQRVYEQASKTQKLHKIMVATDHQGIFDHVKSFGGEVMMTSPNHQNGTERCAEVAAKMGDDYPIVINIQGDEPFINPYQIDQVAELFEDEKTLIATLAKKIISYEELIDEKEAKIALNQNFEVAYMSRSPIPYLRSVAMETWHLHQDYYKHIGIYGFKADVLTKVAQLPPSTLEVSEGLEQLRWTAYYPIKIGFTEFETLAIDTPDDLVKALEYCKMYGV
jgi:3-deoxy-manno-octulosonate cytidylyltransferase (CMP-KDO synthetase)